MKSKILTLVAACMLAGCHPIESGEAPAWEDKAQIEELINRWGSYRDKFAWGQLDDLFVDDGRISISWHCGTHREFVSASEQISSGDTNILKHQFGAPVTEVVGMRAVAETNATVSVRVRAPFGDIDTISHVRFLDRLVKKNGNWNFLDRVGIYEKDTMQLVSGGSIPEQVLKASAEFPEEVRFLALGLASRNQTVSEHLVLDRTPPLELLYEEASEWLNGNLATPYSATACVSN